MAVGKTSYFDLTSDYFTVRVNFAETYNISTNSSIVTISSVQVKSTRWYGSTYYPDGIIKIDGVAAITMNSGKGTHNVRIEQQNIWYPIIESSGDTAVGSAKIVHDADGSKSITVEVIGNRFSKFSFYTTDGTTGGSGWGCSGSSQIELTTIPTYMLAISAGAGSTITVTRTSSGYASTGNISSGSRLYYGDTLKITFSANMNYVLSSHTVNDISFAAGNTYSVTGNVTVVTTAQVLASNVGATDANIGSVSTITVTRFNNNYYHSLQYSFGSLSGYITSTGITQSDESKFSTTSIAFAIPESFYSQIPNAKTGKCTITCRTYDGFDETRILGNATTCTFTVTTTASNCAPVLSVSVEDSNEVTKALTGDSSTLIRYKSTALCTIDATGRNSATISALNIANTEVAGTTSGDMITATKTFANTDKTSFAFSATDSRGYMSTETVSPTVVAYVKLTCNPVITRPLPTGSSIVMTFSGNVYRGSFGAYSNTLTLKYRYKEDGGSYGSWQPIDSANIVFGASSYHSGSAVSLGEEFDYHKSYKFQIQATDGTEDYQLSVATSTVHVQRGVPVFDWGENDFNVNVSLMLQNVNILDIMYPIGSVYMHSVDSIPQEIARFGVWSSLQTGVPNVYAWKRTS